MADKKREGRFMFRKGKKNMQETNPLPLGKKLELVVIKALRWFGYDVQTDIVLDTESAIDLIVRECLRFKSQFRRPIAVQLTCRKQEAGKLLEFNRKAKLAVPGAARLYLEFVAGPNVLEFKTFPLIQVFDRLVCDADLQQAELFRATIEGVMTRLRVIEPDAGENRKVGELQTWIVFPHQRDREYGWIYTPEGEKFHVSWRGFANYRQVADVRKEATAKAVKDRNHVALNIVVSFKAAPPMKRAGHPEAVDIRVTEVESTVEGNAKESA
jgi:hypothetical protein